MFPEIWPSDSAGDGKIAQNNRRTGLAQGKSSFKRKAYCQLCGFPNDLNKIDHTGGSEDGDGSGGLVTKATVTATIKSETWTEVTGNQVARKNSGCAMCFTKNSSKDKVDIVEQMDPLPPFGF